MATRRERRGTSLGTPGFHLLQKGRERIKVDYEGNKSGYIIGVKENNYRGV